MFHANDQVVGDRLSASNGEVIAGGDCRCVCVPKIVRSTPELEQSVLIDALSVGVSLGLMRFSFCRGWKTLALWRQQVRFRIPGELL